MLWPSCGGTLDKCKISNTWASCQASYIEHCYFSIFFIYRFTAFINILNKLEKCLNILIYFNNNNILIIN